MGACIGSQLHGKEKKLWAGALENAAIRVTFFTEGETKTKTPGIHLEDNPKKSVLVEELRPQEVDGRTVYDYEVFAMRPFLGSLELYLKSPRGDILSYAEPSDVIGVLRPLIWDSIGISPDMQRLWFSGAEVDPNKTFNECQIHTKATIWIIMKFRKTRKQTRSQKFIDLTTRLDLQFSEPVPSFREVSPGFSFKAICRTSTCPAFNRITYINKESGTFDIARESRKINCPECRQKARPSRYCGFFQAKWSWEGELGDGVDRWGKGQTEGYKYKRWEEAEREDWVYLRVVVNEMKTDTIEGSSVNPTLQR